MRVQGPGSNGLRVTRVGLGCNNFGRRLDLERTLGASARQHGRTLLEVPIAGLASQPGIASVIAGRRRRSRCARTPLRRTGLSTRRSSRSRPRI